MWNVNGSTMAVMGAVETEINKYFDFETKTTIISVRFFGINVWFVKTSQILGFFHFVTNA